MKKILCNNHGKVLLKHKKKKKLIDIYYNFYIIKQFVILYYNIYIKITNKFFVNFN